MLIPLIFLVAGLLISTQLRDFSEAVIFLFASVGQFVAYVFVSRLRQRGSFFWHVIAAIASNGMWYAVMHTLKIADSYWLLIFPYVCGIVSGRTAGVLLAQFVEKSFDLKADATTDTRLAPGQRLKYIGKEYTFWVLLAILLAYLVYGCFNFNEEFTKSLFVVIGLGIIQNFFYAITARASQRGNSWYIAITGILQGITFFVSATYLLSKGMPASLAVPYILSTALGSATGAFCSMIIEWVMKLRPDSHLDKTVSVIQKKNNAPYIIILSLGIIWILFQETIFNFLGIPIAKLVFPISAITMDLPRIIIVATAALINLLDSSLHTLSSRAGNRNHVGYHIATLMPKGTIDFFRMSYLALNSAIIDILPVAILAGCLGSLFGKDLAERIERWLQARMDIMETPKKAERVTL